MVGDVFVAVDNCEFVFEVVIVFEHEIDVDMECFGVSVYVNTADAVAEKVG